MTSSKGSPQSAMGMAWTWGEEGMIWAWGGMGLGRVALEINRASSIATKLVGGRAQLRLDLPPPAFGQRLRETAVESGRATVRCVRYFDAATLYLMSFALW